MNKFKHYSFDLWLTLIKSDPSFKKERMRFFHAHYNHKKKSEEEVAFIFRQVDLMCNAINEKTGKNIDAEEMYLLVIGLINDHSIDYKNVDLQGLFREMEVLLFKHLPKVYSAQTFTVLDTLKQNGATINILSNTGFIKGKLLRSVLTELKLADFFDFQLYSDEEGVSKPNGDFFGKMVATVFSKRKELTLEDVVHVGDNPVADIWGASQMGIKSVLINSNNETILSVLN
jgi:putative hydrolase of the HAD superfamily